MLISYALAVVLFAMAYQLFSYSLIMKRSFVDPENIIVPRILSDSMVGFKFSLGLSYLSGGFWQLYIAIYKEPIVPLIYLSFVLFINSIVLWKITEMKNKFISLVKR